MTESVSDLQVFGVFVSPGQQHGSKQVPCPHKYSVDFGDIYADFLTASGPVFFRYSEKHKRHSGVKTEAISKAATLRYYADSFLCRSYVLSA